MIRRLDEPNLKAFLDYCRKHRDGLDKSYLSDGDLEKFRIEPANPAFIALDEDMKVIGAASLVIDEAALRARRARLRILHSETGDSGTYEALLDNLVREAYGIDSFYIFSPHTNLSLMSNLKGLGFTTDRFVFLLKREGGPKPEAKLPAGYRFRRFVAGFDEQAWCEIRNSAFSSLKGNESPITAGMVSKMIAGEDYIDGGMLFLVDDEKPIGLIRGSNDEYEGRIVMNIGPLAVLPSYQGRGLGRALLRAMLVFAHEQSYGCTTLCVNADNESALSLYIHEGFKKEEGFACLSITVQNP